MGKPALSRPGHRRGRGTESATSTWRTATVIGRGAGHLGFRPGLAALKRVGYDGFMTLGNRIMGEDKGRALVEAAQPIRKIREAV